MKSVNLALATRFTLVVYYNKEIRKKSSKPLSYILGKEM
jgi:hypothetical protein